jgi:PleD family two-component response regulator
MKPNRGEDLAPHIVAKLAELERIGRAAAAEGASLARRRLDLRRELEEAMKPLRVLVVEDDLMNGPLLAEMLEDLGHIVCAVEVSAAAAVATALHYHPDLMIVDVGLGEASGVNIPRQSRGL